MAQSEVGKLLNDLQKSRDGAKKTAARYVLGTGGASREKALEACERLQNALTQVRERLEQKLQPAP